MPLPVLIAARNEAQWLRGTLTSLPRDGVEPIVIPNGCTDDTAAIAENFGATVLNCPEEGKMQAIQTGIRHLGQRSVEPFVTLDADSQVMFPQHWLGTMLRERSNVDVTRPAVVIGPTVYRGIGLRALVGTARLFYLYHQQRLEKDLGPYCGRNMLIDPHRADLVAALLDLDKLWYGEDQAIKDIVVDHGGNSLKSASLCAAVRSDGSRLPSVWSCLIPGGFQRAHEEVVKSYLAEAPPGSRPYKPVMDRIFGPEEVADMVVTPLPANN
ncbi:MAG TPA: glycosyltransferase [Candidatus Saccharimonadales bacterium]|nr:glycosyltransferase [Candidatus Saccharimonadales bacterium]